MPSPSDRTMKEFVANLKSSGAVECNDIESLAALLGMQRPRKGPFNDPTVRKLLDECLQAAGTPPQWKSLRKYTIVNGEPLPPSKSPPRDCYYEDGQYFQQFDGYILWHGLTVCASEHCKNHAAKIYPDGKVVGTVNCFAMGAMPLDADYANRYLREWLKRIKEQPYWDEVDNEPVKK